VPGAPASDRASQLLQQAIVDRGLVPGERIGTEADLARELNVSRPAVREAVRLLVRANLLRATRGPGGGVFVARSPDRGLAQTVSDAVAGMLANATTSLSELTEVRLLLEVPLAGLAAEHACPETIAELWRAVSDAAAAPQDDLVQRETDVRFHQTIADAAGNRIASALSAWCSQVLQPRLKDLIAPAIVEAVARDQHREIIIAIEQRKPVLAERAMRVHLRYLADLLETVGSPSDHAPQSQAVGNHVAAN
jgi:DNA-binding FadR family transcriptional regulator